MNFIKSPLNYTGGKFKLLPQILPLFPDNIGKFIDLFAGGCNVGVNVNAKKIVCNDHISYLIELFNTLKNNSFEEILSYIEDSIDKFSLSQTNENGYLNLRNHYNKTKYSLDLFVLCCYSFNHLIRFNNSHLFNTPFGKNRSQFNERIKSNLFKFCETIKKKNIEFSNLDFNSFNFLELTSDDFVYCDPPYLITSASYNDGKRGFRDWTEKEETELLNLLDVLNKNNVKFALSNVLSHKGKDNDILMKWSNKYNIHKISSSYACCSYRSVSADKNSNEVLITNY